MRTWGKIAAAVGLLLLAGVVYYVRLGAWPNDRGSKTAYDTYAMCRACGQSYGIAIRTTDHFPLKCEKCGKQEAWPQFQCYKCGNKFVPDPEGSPPHMPVAPHCPKCSSDSVGGVLPDGAKPANRT